MYSHRFKLFAIAYALTTLTGVAVAETRYVDADAVPPGDGLSWATAYDSLEAALAAARANSDISEIRLSGGRYLPTFRTNPGDPRTATFFLRNNLALRGGYAGASWGEAADVRDIDLYRTVLSGDLDGDDFTPIFGPSITLNTTSAADSAMQGPSDRIGGELDETTVRYSFDGFDVTDGAGADILVYAGPPPGGYDYGDITVRVSEDGVNFYTAINTGSFSTHINGGEVRYVNPQGYDISTTGLTFVRYLEVEDLAGGGTFSLDTVAAIRTTDYATPQHTPQNANAYHVLFGFTTTGITLDGLYVAGGIADGPSAFDVDGGGLRLTDGDVEIIDTAFSGCESGTVGGGVYGSTVTVDATNLEVHNCDASGGVFSDGGGMYISGGTLRWTGGGLYSNSGGFGGGLYAESVNVELTDMVVERNYASRGGGLYLYYVPSASLTRVTLQDNEAFQYGGGALTRSSQYLFDDCDVLDNTAGHGGGLSLNGPGTITNSRFDGNFVDGWAAAIEGGSTYMSGTDQTLHILGCSFEYNIAFDDLTGIVAENSVMLFSGNALNMRDCVIRFNQSEDRGAIEIGSGPTDPTRTCLFERCTFENNYADSSIGALYIGAKGSTVRDCTFRNNNGTSLLSHFDTFVEGCVMENNDGQNGGGFAGGGVYRDCYVAYNTATNGGGGYGDADLYNCVLLGNAATGDGGGLYQTGAALAANCAIVGNTAGGSGGGAWANTGAEFINDTILSNTAGSVGGLFAQNDLVVRNTILWDNFDPINGSSEYAQISSPIFTTTASYSCVQGWSGFYGGVGNFGTNPALVALPDPGPDGQWDGIDDYRGNWRPESGSPCVDAGGTSDVPSDTPDLDNDGDDTEPLPLDIYLRPRFSDDALTVDGGSGGPPVVDVGAAEYLRLVGDCNNSGSVEESDIAQVINCVGGPGVIVAPECDCSDGDLDGDVDLEDVAAFVEAFTGL